MYPSSDVSFIKFTFSFILKLSTRIGTGYWRYSPILYCKSYRRLWSS